MKPQFIKDLEKEVKENPVKKYSQTGEEGVILALCKMLGIAKGTFVDFGAGLPGSISNVQYLFELGWAGIGYEGQDIGQHEYIQSPVWIATDNIYQLYKKSGIWANTMEAISRFIIHSNFLRPDFDFMSIDLDGNDYWLLKELIECDCKPCIICAEINGCLPAYPAKTIAYNPDHRYEGDDYYGMSYGAFCDLVEANGYHVVWNQHNLNVFAVRADLLPDFPKGYRPEFTRHQYHKLSTRTDQNWITV